MSLHSSFTDPEIMALDKPDAAYLTEISREQTRIYSRDGRNTAVTLDKLPFPLETGPTHRLETSHSNKRPTPATHGEAYDTDDEEFGSKKSSAPPPKSEAQLAKETCQAVYTSVCKKLGLLPSSKMLRQFGQAHIDVKGQCLGLKGLKSVCTALINDRAVTSLDFTENQLKGKAIAYLADLLEHNGKIQNLNLSCNELNVGGLELVDRLFRDFHALRHLDLSGNKLTDNDGHHIGEIIQNNQHLTSLNLSHNEFREAGGVALGSALATNENLESLDLSWNHLRERGAERVALGLMKNTTLLKLDLGWNGFGYGGCVAMGHALMHNNTLTHLDMRSNRIHPPAMFELLHGIVRNKSLVALNLSQNPITPGVTSFLLAQVRNNKDSDLRLLDLTGIIVNKEFEVILDEIQENRPFEAKYDLALPVHHEKWLQLKRQREHNPGYIYNVDPVRVLYFTKKKLRSIDVFNRMDADKSNKLSREELRKGLEKEDFPLSSSALDALMAYLDINNDGEIDLLEFIEGERRLKRKTLEQNKGVMENSTNMDMLMSALGVPLDPQNIGGRFSKTFRQNQSILPPIDDKLMHTLSPVGQTLLSSSPSGRVSPMKHSKLLHDLSPRGDKVLPPLERQVPIETRSQMISETPRLPPIDTSAIMVSQSNGTDAVDLGVPQRNDSHFNSESLGSLPDHRSRQSGRPKRSLSVPDHLGQQDMEHIRALAGQQGSILMSPTAEDNIEDT